MPHTHTHTHTHKHTHTYTHMHTHAHVHTHAHTLCTQVLSSAQMLSPPDMACLDILAQAVAEARMVEEEQEDLFQDAEVCVVD